MKKEVVIAAIIGVFLGLAVTGIFWTKKEGGLKISLDFLKKQQTETQEEPAPVPEETEKENQEEPAEEVSLDIQQPEDESIVQEGKTTITGETVANATVIIVGEEGEEVTTADENGIFETEISLVGGENFLEIFAFDDNGQNASDFLTITYSTAEF